MSNNFKLTQPKFISDVSKSNYLYEVRTNTIITFNENESNKNNIIPIIFIILSISSIVTSIY